MDKRHGDGAPEITSDVRPDEFLTPPDNMLETVRQPVRVAPPAPPQEEVSAYQLEQDRLLEREAEHAHAVQRKRSREKEKNQNPLPNDVERVLLSTSTAIDASKYWYIQGDSPETGASRYSGVRDHDTGMYKRTHSKAPSPHAYPGAPLEERKKQPGDAFLLGENPEIRKDLGHTSKYDSDRMVIPVEAGGKTKGFVVFDRRYVREWHGQPDKGGFSNDERELARYMVQEHADYFPPETHARKKLRLRDFITPQDVTRPQQNFDEQVAFMKGLDERLFRILDAKAPDQGKHITRVAKLYTDFIREMADADHERPFKVHVTLTPEKLTTLEYAAKFHDADKGAIAADVLSLPNMEQWMFDRFEMHPWQSRDIVDVPKMDRLPVDIHPIIANHHMYLDGIGRSYPFHVLKNPFSPQIDTDISIEEGGGSMKSRWALRSIRDKFAPEPDPTHAHEEKIVAKPMNQWAAIMSIIDKFEAITGRRSYQNPQKSNVMFGPPIPEGQRPDPRKMGALDALHMSALTGEIHPEYFLAFINSETFRNYVEHSDHLGLNEHKVPLTADERQAIEEERQYMNADELKKAGPAPDYRIVAEPRPLTQTEIANVYAYVDQINLEAEPLRRIDAGIPVKDEELTLLTSKILNARAVDRKEALIMYDSGKQDTDMMRAKRSLSPTHPKPGDAGRG